MNKYEVILKHTLVEYKCVDVEADTPEDAIIKAEALGYELGPYDWDGGIGSEEMEAIEVTQFKNT